MTQSQENSLDLIKPLWRVAALRARFIPIFVTGIALACGESSQDSDPKTTCSAGTSRACTAAACAGTQTCDSSGHWSSCECGTAGAGGLGGSAGDAGASSGGAPDAGEDADAALPSGPPSCVSQTEGADDQCGESPTDCCASLAVPGGTFNRDNDPTAPATISAFHLDQFEVTVGRFRNFVNAYPASKPKPGDGAHPGIPDSGWRSEWDTQLPADYAELHAQLTSSSLSPPVTWSDIPGGDERRPINHVNWYLAFAFCAWDGGRLPTTAEWGFAACGGDEQREYPWGAGFDSSRAVVECLAPDASVCPIQDIGFVGSKPNGAGKWGHLDLGGNMVEWNRDVSFGLIPYLKPCTDCAALANPVEAGATALWRGGSFGGPATATLNSACFANNPGLALSGTGFRCAR